MCSINRLVRTNVERISTYVVVVVKLTSKGVALYCKEKQKGANVNRIRPPQHYNSSIEMKHITIKKKKKKAKQTHVQMKCNRRG